MKNLLFFANFSDQSVGRNSRWLAHVRAANAGKSGLFFNFLLLHSFSCCSKASNISFCKLCFVQAVDFFYILLLSSHYVPLVYIVGRHRKISRYSLHCPLEQLNFSAIPWPGARQGMEEETPVHGFPATEGCQSRKVRGALSQLILSLEGELANLPNGG